MSLMLRLTSAVNFHEVEPSPLPDGLDAERRAFWTCARDNNPAIFDGPVLVVSGVSWAGDRCEVSFFESSFSRYLWARASRSAQAPALFASVLATTTDGKLIAGEMSGDTSTPHRVQLPGGNIERRDGPIVTLETARCTAARELSEEVGVEVAAGDLRLTHVKSAGDHGDVGIFFSVDLPSTARDVVHGFAGHRRRLMASGAFVEFENVVTYSSTFWRPAAAPPDSVDYMDDVVRVALGFGEGAVRYCARRSETQPLLEVGVQLC